MFKMDTLKFVNMNTKNTVFQYLQIKSKSRVLSANIIINQWSENNHIKRKIISTVEMLMDTLYYNKDYCLLFIVKYFKPFQESKLFKKIEH